MRAIEPTGRFRKDYKRESKGQHRATLGADLSAVLSALQEDRALAVGYRDHALTGEWKGCRDCHVKPDLVLIYRLLDLDTLQLMRLGSHAELFGS